MPDIYMKRLKLHDRGEVIDCLVPTSRHDHDELSKIPIDKHVKAIVKQQRSIHHHRLYWAAIRKTFDNVEGFLSVDNLSDYVLIKIGHCDTILIHDVTCATPRSISFNKCDQLLFTKLFDDAVNLICTDSRLLNGCLKQDFLDEVMSDTTVS